MQPTVPPAGGGAAGIPAAPLWVALAGGAIAVTGSFLAFSTVQVDGGTESSGGLKGDGVYTLVAALKMLGWLVAGLLAPHVRTRLTLVAGLPALALVGLGVLNLASPERALRSEIEKNGGSGADLDELLALLDVSAGVGVWLVLAGGLVGLGAIAAVGLRARRG